MTHTEIIWIRVGDLHIDRTVQRSAEDRAKIERMKRKFDPDALGVPEVSARQNGNGEPYYVMPDGWHRRTVVLELFGPDEKIQCKVHHGLTIAQEARLFVELNSGSTPRRIDRFLRLVTAGDPDAVAIDGIVRSHGFKITEQRVPRAIRSTEALEGIYRGDQRAKAGPHPEALNATLRLIVQAWGADQPIDGQVLHGIGLVMIRHVGEIDEASLVRKLASFPGGPAGLLGRARGVREVLGGTVVKCVAAEVVTLYNQKRRTRQLPDWWSRGKRQPVQVLEGEQP